MKAKVKARPKQAKPIKPLAGDVETLCAILARIVTRIVSEQQTQSAKAKS